MKKILLTGATGLIGSHCLPLLAEKGYEVHATSSKTSSKMAPLNVHWHEVNLLNLGKLPELIKDIKPNHLLHLAWYVVPGKCWESLHNFRWVQASLDLLHEFTLNGGQRVVMAGTCAEYDWRYSFCSERITPLLPTTVYGSCKHALQVMFDAFSKQNGLSGAWGRIFFLYGPQEHYTRLVASVTRSLLLGQPALCSHGNQLRDYLYVQDVAEAFVALLESDVRGPVNIASGSPVSLKQIIYKIGQKLNREDLVQLGALPPVPDEPDFLVANTNRLLNEVGWSPRYDLDQGLEETIDWWRNQLKHKKLS